MIIFVGYRGLDFNSEAVTFWAWVNGRTFFV